MLANQKQMKKISELDCGITRPEASKVWEIQDLESQAQRAFLHLLSWVTDSITVRITAPSATPQHIMACELAVLLNEKQEKKNKIKLFPEGQEIYSSPQI